LVEPISKRMQKITLLLALLWGNPFLFAQTALLTQPGEGPALELSTIRLSGEFLYPTSDDPQPYAWTAPQACQLPDGTWITAFTDQHFDLQIHRISPQGQVKRLRIIPQANAYGLAAKGNQFALLRVPFALDDGTYEGGNLFFDLFYADGRRRQSLQLTGTEERRKERTELRHSFPASLQATADGFQVYYDFYRDNGRYSGDYSRWITITDQLQVVERIENYNRVLRSQVGQSDSLQWVVHLPTRNPRALALQVFDPENHEDEWDIEEYELYAIKDGQEKEQFMCSDGVMPFAFGDALTLDEKVYVSFVDAFRRKDYNAGVLVVDPRSGAVETLWLEAPAGYQASIPRLGKVKGQLVVLQKELPGEHETKTKDQWRKNGKRYFEPEKADVVMLRVLQASGTFSPGKRMPLNWLDQPANESSTSVYLRYRDLMNDLIGVRAFQGQDEMLVFDAEGGELTCQIIGAKESAETNRVGR
jgi:hypothetical protein